MLKSLPILLVDDDVVDQKTVKRAFAKQHVANPIHTVSNGREALDYLRHEGKYADDPAAAPRLGIILLDLSMPVMNGVEFLDVVKKDEELKSIPVIVLTTSREETDRVASYDKSIAGYVVKPVEFAKFMDVVSVIDMYWTLCEQPS